MSGNVFWLLVDPMGFDSGFDPNGDIGSILGMSGSVFCYLVDPKGGTNSIRVEAIG